MKLRGGFVSNSSSSSFVLIGYELDRDFDSKEFIKQKYPEKYAEITSQEKEDWQIEDDLCDLLYESGDEYARVLSSDGPAFVGFLLGEEKDFQLAEGNYSGEKLLEIMEKVRVAVGREEKPSLLFGTRAC